MLKSITTSENDTCRRNSTNSLSRHAPILAGSVILTFALIYVSQSLQHDNLSWRERFLRAEEYEMLFPLSSKDVAGFMLAGVGLVISAGGGIGGGGLLVPIYILVLGFDARHAIPLSNVTVFGGAVANTLFNVKKRHPLANRPLIDWDLISIMEPMTIAGALIGTNLNKLLPESVIVVLLLLILVLTAHKTLRKAQQLHHKEQWSVLENKDVDEEDTDIDLELGKAPTKTKSSVLRRQSSAPTAPKLLPRNSPFQRSRSAPLSVNDDSAFASDAFQSLDTSNKPPNDKSLEHPKCDVTESSGSSPSLTEILDAESRVPYRNVVVIVALFFVVLAINILKGGGAFPSPIGIECGSNAFWIAQGGLFLAILAVSFDSRRQLLRKTRQKDALGYKYLEGDIRWNHWTTATFPLLCCGAGFVAGLFGIGGGIVKGPVMLALGVHPSVASATSACMILFTSFTATTSFLVFGMVIPDYAIFCLVLGFVSSVIGQTIMSYILSKYRRTSYIAFCIGTVVALSAVCMTLESFVSLASSEPSEPHSLCGGSHLES